MAKIRNSNPKQSDDKALHEEFEAFCKAHDMSKVGATEQAIG